MKTLIRILSVFMCLPLRATVDAVGELAFYPEDDVTSSSFWENALNDELSRRAFVLYSMHTANEYQELTALEGKRVNYTIHEANPVEGGAGGVYWVYDFPATSDFCCRFVVWKDDAGRGLYAVQTGEFVPKPESERLDGRRFEVGVDISKDLVGRYLREQVNPLKSFPFLADAIRKAFSGSKYGIGSESRFCLVGPMMRTDGRVLVYADGHFWGVSLPLPTDEENVRFFCNHPLLFIRCVETIPDDEFWESDNLKEEDSRFFHSYLLKLYEQILLKGDCVCLDKDPCLTLPYRVSGDHVLIGRSDEGNCDVETEERVAIRTVDLPASETFVVPSKIEGLPVSDICVSAFENCGVVRRVVIPEGVKGIAFGAFSSCSNLTEIAFPSSVEWIDERFISHCPALAHFEVAPGNTNFVVRGGLLLSHDGTTVESCPGGLTEVTVPKTVNYLGKAFIGATKLRKIHFECPPPDDEFDQMYRLIKNCPGIEITYPPEHADEWKTFLGKIREEIGSL